MPFTTADIVILVIMILSGLLALMRGFIREVITIVAWVGAALAAMYGYAIFSPTLSNAVPMFGGLVGNGLAALLPFLGALFLLSYVSGKLVTRFSGAQPGPFDGTAGFFFGLGRGFILVCVSYLAFEFLYQPEVTPPVLAKARFMPLIENTNNYFKSAIPNKQYQTKKKTKTTKSTATTSSTPASSPSKEDEEDVGYSKQDRGAIDQLFESSEDE